MTDERTPSEIADGLRRSLLADYLVTFTTDAGKRVLLDLERTSYVGKTTLQRLVGQNVDPFALTYNEGMRAKVLEIKARVAEAQLGQTEPTQTHAVSSTATQEP